MDTHSDRSESPVLLELPQNIELLKNVYVDKILPVETTYHFDQFYTPITTQPNCFAKPVVMFMGTYSSGKTSFIKYLLGQDYPGMNIGPEPTTDSFTALMHGTEERTVDGNTHVADKNNEFAQLIGFGNTFLDRFQCSMSNSSVLESISIIDTPGILAGEKKQANRDYDYVAVAEWFAQRADLIIILFDVNKLDISDELKLVIEAFKKHLRKIRIVLNKIDMVEKHEIPQVQSALAWNLGQILGTPEIPRVYKGSFWNKRKKNEGSTIPRETDEAKLFMEIQNLLRNHGSRTLDNFIRRARLAKVHAYIMSSLHQQMTSFSLFKSRETKKTEIINRLEETFKSIEREKNIPTGDFPDLNKMKEKLKKFDFSTLRGLQKDLLEVVDQFLKDDTPLIAKQIELNDMASCTSNKKIVGGAFDLVVPLSL